MADNTEAANTPAELSRALAEIASRSQQLVRNFLAREESAHHLSMVDTLRMGRLFQDLYARLMADPMQLAQRQLAFWQDYTLLMQRSTLRMMGFDIEPMIRPHEKDKRFKHESWESNLLFDFIKQSYLLTADYLHHTVKNIEGLDDKTEKKIDFYTRQFINAMSPSNFLATNPEILSKTIESRGQNLLKGLNNLLEDLERGGGALKIRMTDPDAFELGRDLALTPGKVIHQTDLAQLIQYEPATEQVYKRPILFIPPWINKYYILDLQPKNSLIKWLVERGHTVFTLSWRNPSAAFADKAFDDYLLEGPLAALDAIGQAVDAKEINLVGYCLGGTLLACALAYMAARKDHRAHSATFFTSLLDFENPGELEIFVDEDQLKSLEQQMERRGYLVGDQMARTMSSLRANDLIWSFFVNNYLRGEDPFPFDLLYWNQDSTNMPARMHAFYLRNMYLENRLREPGGVVLAGEPIDLGKVKVPAFFLSTREDHIAPWKATYQGLRLLSGKARFVLSGSGHIAGVINPPAKNKYGYWTNTRAPEDPDEWLAAAEYHPGSWWPHWLGWLNSKGGAKVAGRQVGAGQLEPIEDAPGSYVRERHD
ncbi:class I poly(R)-hydroxyalkanoic acid synthase [Nitrococcus mobilis]|uniref:Poly(3-hydroxyalkanoate) synthetase n=1 Tax=Nitrococcus mobilis Nb-231 TaxID=314278 RepID=A4BVM3_9GAMM|nr:class I poly(R)-hydroxyalkanoic acid synthase [Nitrococcus mobilis]EAR20241.1 Poly(3-hydroxyalkanoate) synthetase [Nitrococcus mobilis Nb-231]